jgi:hypothetical protein
MAIEVTQQQAESGAATRVRRLNWGCGSDARRGWINCDQTGGPGVDMVADLRGGLPMENAMIDYSVSIHGLQELAYDELSPALGELLRVLRPGGTLRLVVPDLDADIRAYTEHEDAHFAVPPGQVRSRGGRFIAHILGGGEARTLFTFDFAEELLLGAGFVDVTRCRPGETASDVEEIVELDPREGGDLFIEATRPPGRHPFIEVLEALPVEQQAERRLAARHLDAPQRGTHSHDGSLEIVGWVVGRESPAIQVEVLADGRAMGRTPVELARPGVGREFARFPGSGSAGFRIRLMAEGEGVSELLLKAVLEDGLSIPLWTLRVRASRQPPADPDSSPRPTKAGGGGAAPAR